MTTATNTKFQTNIQNINQEFKERDVQEKAKRLGLPYVNLINMPINSDLAKIINKKDIIEAEIAIFFKSGKKLRIAVVDPDNDKTKALLEELKKKNYSANINLCSDESLKSAHRIYFSETYKKQEEIKNVIKENDLGSFVNEIENLEQLKDKIENATFDAALNYVQVGGYKTHASDIHFQPEEDHVMVRFRIDGVLQPVFNLTRNIYDGILKEIKYLSHLKLNVTDVPQDGQYNFLVNQRKINVRVSILPTQYGETCVIRLLDSQKTFTDFSDLGFEGEALRNMEEAVNLPHGMVLITGPTGSGKTTTMYSMLQSIDTQAKKVITIEDPIEYDLSGITQSQVNPDGDYNFSDGLRAILRQDPDIIMVGEIRDLETAETASQASLTGHLVISTLHTNSAIESIPRLVNMGVKSFILAPALDLIIAQRLVRKLCSKCVKTKPITDTEKAHIENTLQSIEAKGLKVPAMPKKLSHAQKCKECGQTGFHGQIAITEVLRFNQNLRDMILENEPMPEIYKYIEKNCKMLTLHEDGIIKAIRGVTTLDEVYRVVI